MNGLQLGNIYMHISNFLCVDTVSYKKWHLDEHTKSSSIDYIHCLISYKTLWAQNCRSKKIFTRRLYFYMLYLRSCEGVALERAVHYRAHVSHTWTPKIYVHRSTLLVGIQNCPKLSLLTWKLILTPSFGNENEIELICIDVLSYMSSFLSRS